MFSCDKQLEQRTLNLNVFQDHVTQNIQIQSMILYLEPDTFLNCSALLQIQHKVIHFLLVGYKDVFGCIDGEYI